GPPRHRPLADADSQPVTGDGSAAGARSTRIDRGSTSRGAAAVPLRAGSNVSQEISQLRAARSAGIWNFNGSHQELTKKRKSSSTSASPCEDTSGSVAPSTNNATLRASGSAQFSDVMSVPDGVNQRRSAASFPVR